MVASQLNDYVCSNGLENVKQSAYKLGHSTETALLSIKNDVHLALARGEATAVVLLDQSAAFDTIDHGTLLGCLSSWFGVGGVVLEWFKSYLSDRLVLFCLVQRSSCVEYHRALSWVLYSFPYILLPSAKSFEIIPA